MRSFLARLTSIGVTPGLGPRLSKVIRLTNGFCLTLAASAVPFLILGLATGDWQAVTVNLLGVAHAFALMGLNYLGYHRLARWSLCVSANLIFYVLGSAAGPALGLDFAFLSIIVLPFLVFEYEEKKQVLFFVLLTVAGFFLLRYWGYEHPPFVLQARNFEMQRFLSSCAALLILVASVAYLRRLNHWSEVGLGHAARMSSLGQMASGIAHEINNPLAAITLQTERLIDGIERGTLAKEQSLALLERTQNTALRISRIVWGLQAFARDTSGEPLVPTPVQSLVRDTLELCYERFRKGGVDLVVPEVPESLVVDCRAPQIAQVLLNLLNNAFDAVKDCEKREVRIEVQGRDEEVSIAVTDSGPGVSSEARNRIFMPFYTTKPVGSGTGLGLSISLGLVQAHSGSLQLDPRSDRTRFVVTLPERRPG